MSARLTWVWDDYMEWWAAYPPGLDRERHPGRWIAAVDGPRVLRFDPWSDDPWDERTGFANEAAARAWVEAHVAELWELVWP